MTRFANLVLLIINLMGNENFMEELADSIYDQIVTENFKDLTTDEEQLVYEIACTRANEQFESGAYE